MLMAAPPLYQQIAPDVKLGKGVRIFGFTNLYGCQVGDDVKIGTFVEIQKGAKIGNRCKISMSPCTSVQITRGLFESGKTPNDPMRKERGVIPWQAR